MVTVYPIGTNVRFRGTDINGIVTAVCYRKYISYEISWFDGRKRITDWCEETELVFDEESMTEIGFHAIRNK